MSLSEHDIAEANHGTITMVKDLFVRKLQLKFGGPFVLQLRSRETSDTEPVLKFSEEFSSKDHGSAQVTVAWLNNHCLGEKPVTSALLSGSNSCSPWQSHDHPLGQPGA